MRLPLLFFVLCLAANAALGQSYLHRFPNAAGDQFFTTITPLSGDRVATGGSAFAGSDKAVVVMLDGEGNVMWNRFYEGSPAGAWAANGFGETSDGNLLALISRTTSLTRFTRLARLSAQNGQVLGAQQMGNDERAAVYLDIRRTSDGFVMAGTVDDIDQKSCFSLLKTDPQGNILWQRSVRDSTLEGSLSFVTVGDDGSFWALGQTQVDIWAPATVTLLHFAPDGAFLNAYHLLPQEPGRKVSLYSIDYQPGTGPVVGLFYFFDGPSSVQPAVVQCNTQGEVVWAKQIATPPSEYQQPMVRRLSDGNLLVGCGSGGAPNLGVLVKLTPDGEALWARDFTAEEGVESLLGMEIDAADNAYGVGVSFTPIPNLARNGFVFRTDDARFDTASCCSREVDWGTVSVPFTTVALPLQPGYDMQPQTSSLLQSNGTTSRVDVCQSDFEPTVVQSDSVVCPGQCVTLLPGTSTGPTYTFSAPGAQPETGILDDSVTLCFPGEGLYTISINASACARTAVQVRVRQLTPEAFSLSDSVICPGACVGIVAPMLNDSFSYVWEFPGAVSDTLVVGPVPPSEVCYATVGIYTLQLSIEGCGSTSLPLEVSARPYAVPNAFTPDGDSVNDVFVPLIECPTGPYQLSIYNRWGQKVFTSVDLAQGWDGTQNGSPSASDVYVWTLEFEDVQANGQVVRRAVHGDVTLIR